MVVLGSSASAAVPYGDKLMGMLGRSILHPEINDWMDEMHNEETVEKFDPNLNLYSVEYRDQGVALDFTINFILKGIRLFDKGKIFDRYDFVLPNGLRFDMNIEDVLVADEKFVWDQLDPYHVEAYHDSLSILVYLRNNQVELVHLRANDTLVFQKEYESAREWKFRLFPDGHCIAGKCIDSAGVMYWGNGKIKYSGDWDYGFPSGEGIFMDSFGHAYAGDFYMGFFWGKGDYRDAGNFDYSGEFVMGTKTGSGTAIYSNGYKYQGEWLNDLFHGKGVYYQQKGYVFEGEFYEGRYHGQGRMTSPVGYFKGSFKNGVPHGEGVQYSVEGDVSVKGTWIDGKKEGKFEFNTSDGRSAILFYENDVEVKR